MKTALAAVATSALPSWSQPTHKRLRCSDVHVEDYPTVQAVRWIGECLQRETDGRLSLSLYHSGQLGREAETIDMTRFGAVDITRVYSGALNNAFPLTQALCLPYVFQSRTHLRQVIDGGVGQQVLQGFAQRDLVGLAIYDSGARCFYNNRMALTHPRDLRGLKLRVSMSDIFIQLVRQLGANPTPMSLGETFSGIETRMIDGAENNMMSFHSSRHFEAARYWSQTRHSYAPDILLMSRRALAALSPPDRDLVRDIARASVKVFRQRWDASEQAAARAVTAAGVRVNDVDVEAFRAAALPLVRRFRGDALIAPLLRQIEAVT